MKSPKRASRHHCMRVADSRAAAGPSCGVVPAQAGASDRRSAIAKCERVQEGAIMGFVGFCFGAEGARASARRAPGATALPGAVGGLGRVFALRAFGPRPGMPTYDLAAPRALDPRPSPLPSLP